MKVSMVLLTPSNECAKDDSSRAFAFARPQQRGRTPEFILVDEGKGFTFGGDLVKEALHMSGEAQLK